MRLLKLLLIVVILVSTASPLLAQNKHSKDEQIRIIFSNNLFGQVESCG